MIKFITVWILTVSYVDISGHSGGASHYQLQYATQSICEKQRKNHVGHYKASRCDFQQVPVYVGSK